MSGKPKKKFLIVRADFLLPITEGTEERIQDGYVLCEEATIKEVGHYTDDIGQRILQECGDDLQVVGDDIKRITGEQIPRLKAVICPGFVKAHGHDHEATIIGLCRDVPLVDWLDGVVNPFTRFLQDQHEMLRQKFRRSPNMLAYRKARMDDIYYGITSNLAHHCNFNKYYVEDLVQANVEAGTKMIIAVGSQDRHYDEKVLDLPAQIAVDRLDKYKSQFGSAPRTWIIPGPDQVFSNSEEILTLQKNWAKENGTLIHIHSAEEYNTTQWFINKYKQTEVEFLDSFGFLDENTMLAHQVHTTENDMKILAERHVKIVHNPLANTILGSGMPDIIRMLELGIDVAISTDGSGSSDNQNILAAAKLASQYQRALHHNARLLPAYQCLEMITRIPAKMLRLNCGQLKPGLDADISVIDLTRPNLIPTRKENVVENIIWASDGSEVRWVVANGVLVKDNYSFTQINVEEILSEISELQALYLDYIKHVPIIRATGARADDSKGN
ncbi:MAG: putative 5-methylthioadenosine/S-adenosylhomocysteine deaminase [Streblomastix strix]|uniref:Putative 5-methylthioadenosine/S-adenosylhomocysteine deaminase n=1 Tax=Streblomastix strix TaxID=222440 RepID=A0A5J4VT56_9EUKA|nr:MAG: putative 5-methylthioadenosine/S-adenosylhomocysteine deaminase [Streblomastix strix]